MVVKMPPLGVNQVAMTVSARTRTVIPPNRPVGADPQFTSGVSPKDIHDG